MAESDQDKTEQPTERKREQSRKDGMVSYSKEVAFLISIGTTIALFYFLGSFFVNIAKNMLVSALSNIDRGTGNSEAMLGFTKDIFSQSLLLVAIICLSLMFAGILAGIVQVGFRFSGKPLVPEISKLSLIKGFGRIFNLKKLAELFSILAKISLIAYVGYLSITNNFIDILNLSINQRPDYIEQSFGFLADFMFTILPIFFIIAVLDFGMNRFEFEQKLKMSKQEVKDENKQSEGDPLIRQRIRQAQRKLSQARMIQEVPKADVVITNPTHYAVVLKYDRETMTSPQLVAKGIDFLALRIMEVAEKSGVPVMRNPPVARGMYAQMEIGDEIPEEFYKIVAEILAFVYKQKNKKVS